MADLTKFKNMFGIQEPEQFNMTAPENLFALPQDEETINPEDLEPAIEEPVSKQLATDEEIKKIQAIPMPDAQKSIPVDPVVEQLDQVKQEEIKPSVLEQLQKARADKAQQLNLVQGSNQIAQAIAMGSGAKIGDGSEAVNSLRNQLDQPIKDYDKKIEDEENDANSDVSKFMREQAYSILKKINPEKQYDLEKMTANQLKKAFGSKLLSSQVSAPLEWVATDRVTEDGTPVKFNRKTGEFMAGNRIIQPGENTPRDISRRDTLTGQYGRTGAGGGLIVQPTSYSAVDKNLKTSTTNEITGETKQENIKFSDFQKQAPEVGKQITKIKDQFINDMKTARENAAAAVTLASKLKPGPNGEVDSGLLGGIQTQAAKLAGQKGVLTDQDLVKFAGAGGVVAKISRIIDGSLFGEMTEDDIKFFKRFSQLMNSSTDKIIENDSKYYIDQVKQVAEGFAPGFTDENAREWLSVNKVAPSVQDKKNKGTEQDPVVKVKGPSGQIAEMLKSKAEKYLKKAGYELVK